MSSPKSSILAIHRRARHDYEILESYEAGIALLGSEVKSIRGNRFHFADAYAAFQGGELFLLQFHIDPYPQAADPPDPLRSRKLLLHRAELNRLRGKVEGAGLSMVPLDLHLRRGNIKVKLGLVRGKKQHDKRRSLQEKELRKEIDHYSS